MTPLTPRQVYHLAGLFFSAVLPYNQRDATRVWAMSYPTIYDVSYSYTGFQAALGDGSFPGTQLDADMAGLSDSVASINAFIQTAFRSDGVLKAASLPGTDPILQYVDEAATAAAAEATEIATTAATSASASAAAAAGSATSAVTSETQAATSASAAQTARTGAETAQIAAAASADEAAASAALAATFDPNLFYLRTVLDAKFDAVDADFATVDEKLSAKASKRNRLLNSAFQICQDLATGATVAISANRYAFDGVSIGVVGGGVLICSQAVKVTPGGSPYRFRGAVSTADTAIAPTDVYLIKTPIEGVDVADLMFGSASAQPFCWRGVVNLPAGTYGLSFRNAASDRSYVTLFTISAGQAGSDVLVSAVVPGDVTGTWVSDATGAGLVVSVCLAAGSTFQTATTDARQAGNYVTTSDQTNGMVSTANVFELADVGLYAGDELPAWEMQSYADDLSKCQRYFGYLAYDSYKDSSGTIVTNMYPKTELRSIPALSYINTYSSGTVTAQTTLYDAVTGALRMSFTGTSTYEVIGRLTYNSRL